MSAIVTEEALAKLRARLGTEVAIDTPPHLTEITRDGLRHWAYGIGDRNPLWLQGTVAPPSILFAFNRLAAGYTGGLPGVHALYAGSDYTFERWPRLGDQLEARAVFEELRERESRFAGRAFDQITRVRFTDQDGGAVAEGTSLVVRTESSKSKEKGEHERLSPHVYEPDELEAIYAEVDAEQRRGTEPRHWEDVEVGEELPAVVKGPLTLSDNIVYAMGAGGVFVRSHGFARDYFRRHPAAGFPNPQGVPEFAERVHWDPEFARTIGLPHAYDYGGQRYAWMGHLVTNWMGDSGFLRRLRVEFRRFNLIGDTTWCRGRVTRVFEEPGREDAGDGAVEVELWAHDQRGQRTTAGVAVVRLPRRGR